MMSGSVGAGWSERGEGAEPPRVGDSIHAAVGLLDEALALTRAAAERLDDAAPDEALDLLAERDGPFVEAGEMLGRLSSYAESGGEGFTAFELALIRRVGADLGRIDSHITARLKAIQNTLRSEIESPEETDGSAAGAEAVSRRRRLDLRG